MAAPSRVELRIAVAWLAAALAGLACEAAEDVPAAGDAGDTGSETAGDADSDADCPGYPPPPHDWDLGEVVTPERFPAIHGPDGPLTELDMCDVLADAEEVKSIVFVVGTVTCPYCPERFTEIGALDLAAYAAEKAAVYYDDQAGNASLEPGEVSDIADTYGWTDGWRISDTADQAIFNGGYPDWLWQTTPNVFILDTHAMEIVAAEKGSSPTLLDVLAEVQQIDAAHP